MSFDLQLTDRFKKGLHGLPEEIRNSVKKTIRLLATNPRHPSLLARKQKNSALQRLLENLKSSS